jgi:hypothetical protein
MISGRFLLESRGSWQEFTGTNPDNFRSEYCFHVPAISGIFLQDPVVGIINLGHYHKLDINILFFHFLHHL